MPSRPWYKKNPGEYMADTVDLSLEEDGLYNRLLDLYWLHGGPLPADLRQLSRRCRVDLRQLRRIWKVIHKHFPESNGLIHNKRMDQDLAQFAELSEKRRAAITKRWDTNEDTNESGGGNTSVPVRARVTRSQSIENDDQGVVVKPPARARASPAPDQTKTLADWQAWLVNSAGATFHQAKSVATSLMIADWVAAGLTEGEATIAIEAAQAKLGQAPDSPTYYKNFVAEVLRGRNAASADGEQVGAANSTQPTIDAAQQGGAYAHGSHFGNNPGGGKIPAAERTERAYDEWRQRQERVH